MFNNSKYCIIQYITLRPPTQLSASLSKRKASRPPSFSLQICSIWKADSISWQLTWGAEHFSTFAARKTAAQPIYFSLYSYIGARRVSQRMKETRDLNFLFMPPESWDKSFSIKVQAWVCLVSKVSLKSIMRRIFCSMATSQSLRQELQVQSMNLFRDQGYIYSYLADIKRQVTARSWPLAGPMSLIVSRPRSNIFTAMKMVYLFIFERWDTSSIHSTVVLRISELNCLFLTLFLSADSGLHLIGSVTRGVMFSFELDEFRDKDCFVCIVF